MPCMALQCKDFYKINVVHELSLKNGWLSPISFFDNFNNTS